MMKLCKNCQEPLSGAYCAACGQKADVGPISLRQLISDLPKSVFHVDKGLLFNIIQLFRRPGPAIRDYLDGKRKPFFHPATYLVVTLVLNYLVVLVTDLHFYDEHELEAMSPLKAKAIKDYDAMQWWFLEHTYVYILVAICASSLFLFLVYRMAGLRLNIAEIAVVVLFTISQGVFIQSIIYFIFGWVDSGPFIRGVEMVNMAILVLYASYVSFQMLFSVTGKIKKCILAFTGGAGLAVVWIASAYFLYLLFG